MIRTVCIGMTFLERNLAVLIKILKDKLVIVKICPKKISRELFEEL